MNGEAARLRRERMRAKSHGHAAVVDVAEPCRAWRDALPAAPALCRRAALAVLAAASAGLHGAELSIVLADDALLRRLNKEWRGKDAPTNVLSFPAQLFAEGTIAAAGDGLGAPLPLGDVVLGLETIRREAAAQGKPLADHLLHLTVHGVLHLLGFDHEDEPGAERMEGLERTILATLGVADPYEPRAAVLEAEHG